MLRREVGAAAAARQRKGGDMEVRCARPGCGQAEPLLARRREKMKKCATCHAVYSAFENKVYSIIKLPAATQIGKAFRNQKSFLNQKVFRIKSAQLK